MVKKCYDCESYCEPCLHETKEEAIQCAKEHEDYLNSPCEYCNNGTLKKDCNRINHMLSIGMIKDCRWNLCNEKKGVKNNE